MKSLRLSFRSTTASPSISAISRARPQTASAIAGKRYVKSALRRLQMSTSSSRVAASVSNLSTQLEMNTSFVPDREPVPAREARPHPEREPESERQPKPAGAAVTVPDPVHGCGIRTIHLRILDREGHEVFGRQKAAGR